MGGDWTTRRLQTKMSPNVSQYKQSVWLLHSHKQTELSLQIQGRTCITVKVERWLVTNSRVKSTAGPRDEHEALNSDTIKAAISLSLCYVQYNQQSKDRTVWLMIRQKKNKNKTVKKTNIWVLQQFGIKLFWSPAVSYFPHFSFFFFLHRWRRRLKSTAQRTSHVSYSD